MANRMFHPNGGALEQRVVTLYGTATIGASGAVSASTGKGIATIVRTSAGKYTVTLSDSYNSLMYGDCKLLHSTLSDPNTVGIYANLFSTAVTGATPTVVFQFQNVTDGAAADPASGAVIYFKFDLKNSTV
jgi:hypothetical protein